MDMFTSYFGYVSRLPDFVEPIAICGGIPKSWKGEWTRIVAPKLAFFNEWKYVNHDNDYYIRHFNDEVLSKLEPNHVLEVMVGLSHGKTPCMICYEKPDEFCHRHLVSDWLNRKIDGMNCREYRETEFQTKDEQGVELF